MKPYGLLLLLAALMMHTVYAQPTNISSLRKLSPVLQGRIKLLPKNQQQVFWIVTTNTDSVKNFLRSQQVPVTGEYSSGLLVITTTRAIIDSVLAPSPLIRFIDIPRIPQEEQPLPAFDNALNTINRIHQTFPAINGHSMVVSVKENQPDSTDIDFTGRFLSTPLGSGIITQHATAMATIIAGGGNSFYTGKGAAPGATISSSSFASLLPDANNQYQQYGISVQNHSYGTSIENYYGADAAAYDASVNSNPQLVHVFSAGNSGSSASTSGIYTGIANMANITGSFKMAKNIITVGATDSFGNVTFLSSKGPAYDGRIKPDLVAFGEDGSSGAAAITSGSILLLQQAWKEQHAGTLPAAALIKAALLNSAGDSGPKGPDFQSGYGSLNTYKALQTLVNEHYYAGSVTQGGTQTFSLPVPANIRQLKITVCWNDPAAVANASKALINDIDMELVHTGSGATWLPWVLNSEPVADSLLLPAVRTKDSLNSAEQITLDNPQAGTYTIRIKGFSIPAGGTQPFFIAWQLDTADQYQWQYPVSTDHLTGGTKNILRWSSTFSTAAGQIEYSLNKGTTWQLLTTAAPLSAGYFSWQAPDTFCLGLLRMTINGQMFVSDTFTISSPLPIEVGFNCTDSVMLYWPRVPAVDGYAVYRLGPTYLQPVSVIADTSIIIHNPGLSHHYTVAPVINGNRQGIKAYTIDFTTQGVGCYLKNFLADLVDGNTSPATWQARLTIGIGTIYNVKSLTVEKLTRNGYISLQTIQPVTALQYQLADPVLTDGANTYRVKIELLNGLVIYSDPQTIYYFSNNGYLVFPNPAKATGLLQVVSANPGNTQFLLYNAWGQKVREYILVETTETIPLQGLKNGVYFILILKNGKKDYVGKLVIQ